MNLTQILRGQDATLTLSVYADGDLSDEGDPTLTLRHVNGTEVTLDVTDNGNGTYEATIPAFDDLGLHFAVLTFGDSLTFNQGAIEIVGNFLFTENQARQFADGKLTEGKFADDEIAAERIRITDWLEARTGVSWVPRYRRVTLRGSGGHWISLLDASKSQGPSGGEGARAYIQKVLTINGEVVDEADIDIEGWRIYWDAGTFTRSHRPDVTIEYEYGHPHLVSGVDRVALLEVADRLPTSRLSRAAVSANDDLGSYGWEPQNNGRPSRVPEVNEWCRTHDERIPVA